jgi:CRISPR-associated protein Csx3
MKQTIVQPAVLIGGPPHAGKSVLTYSLTRALRQYGIEHYVMRACPDGEGHWSQETPRQVAEDIRQKGAFSDVYIQRVCTNIAMRQMPFLVDVGGLPQGEQFQIFQHCTHAIILRHRSPSTIDWHAIVERNRLHLLADLVSELDGIPDLEMQESVLRGTLSGLERGTTIQGEPFDSLVRLLITLFTETSEGLKAAHTEKAHTELVLNLPQLLDSFAPGCIDWSSEMLPRLLAEVPAQTPLSVYGRAPYWIYSALLLHTRPAPFYQFDARLGWLQPIEVQSGLESHPEILFEVEKRPDFTILHTFLHNQNLDYRQTSGLQAPQLSENAGLILNGKLPLWLSNALAGLYQQSNLPWIAGYYPQKQGAIVTWSRVPERTPGDLIPLTLASRHF